MKLTNLIKILSYLTWFVSAAVFANSTFSNVATTDTSLANKAYIEVTADFSGSFVRSDRSRGSFTVPVTALFPKGKCNNTAVIDVVNSVLFEFPITPLGYTPLYFARMFLGDDVLSGRNNDAGFTYYSVQWNKSVIDYEGSGHLEQATDGYIVLEELSKAVRQTKLEKYLSAKPGCKIQHTIGFGWSQSGKLLADMLTSELNGKRGTPIFDGLFLGVAGGICRSLQDTTFPWAYHNCSEPPEKHVPTIAFNTQSEIELSIGSGALRAPSEYLSVYEYAGLAHIDANFLPFDIVFGGFGFEFKQNPVSVVPAVRASFWNLYLQVKYGMSPAPSQLMYSSFVDTPAVSFLDLRNDPAAMSWSGGDVYTADQDGDGSAEGGIRLPHMSTVLNVGSPVAIGAPLGDYGGIDFNYAGGGGIFFANGGTFDPYSAEELALRYPTKDDYMMKVRSAVVYLVLSRYLLLEDGMKMVEEADSVALPHWD
ncbi:alpha/beta hydrolase domain-containing protein [Vibrio hangzhouensis]|uniref:Alpha/beta hydrolase domain-containing protein n=1 Tax=Vibrio hangzhouensis TaxID=462991 RepID=A0A1H5SG44_9VIBR|nr:alpha/beta hydrolase domain-containing protein [Vibrio hangzhouensis]SEF49673.1 hypothetical protein SAMN04488244_101358 [Vibrio hangzhouensis]